MTALKPQTRKWTRGILPHGGLEYYRQNPPQPAERPKGVHYTELAVHRRILNHLDNFSHAAPGFLLARRPSRGYDPFCRPDRNRPPAAGSLSPDPRTAPCPAALRGCRSSASPPSSSARRHPRRAPRDHWSFRPVHAPPVPAVKDSAWVRTPIDAFILARLEAEGLRPAPPADKNTLLRRVYFDLIGLPPTPDEQKAFLEDASPRAFEKVVDGLLARPEYGERWARHWLDVVRYADSNGYERDGAKPSAWRYRDYVIDALNKDKPYDRFVTEQLAGDEAAGANAETQHCDDVPAAGDVGRRAGRPGRRSLRPDGRRAGHDGLGLSRRDAALRPLPRPQVRAVHAEGLLRNAGRVRPAEAAADRPAGTGSAGRDPEEMRPYQEAQERWEAELRASKSAWTR